MHGPLGPPESRYPPKENDLKSKAPPKPGTAWAEAMTGMEDARCSLKEEHVYNLFHALGINPNCAWPPPIEIELYLREGK